MHHICQTDYEYKNGYNFQMTKKCYTCLLVTIAEYEKNKNSSSPVSPRESAPRESDIPPPGTNIASQNVDKSPPPTIPTNVAPETPPVDKNLATTPTDVAPVPPEDILINDGEELPLQHGFSKNSGIFGSKIIFMGRAICEESKRMREYGRIIEIPKKKQIRLIM